jgi:hypothetical protein
MINWTPPQGTKITYPSKSLHDRTFNYQRGSDVQARWREYGWTPPSENMTPPPPEKVRCQ